MTIQHRQLQTVGEYADCISYSWKFHGLDEALKKFGSVTFWVAIPSE